MNSKEQLMYLLKRYHEGDYDTKIFVDEYDRIYNFETDYL